MADSALMPNVNSSAVRVALPAAVSDRVDTTASTVGLSRDELVELLLRSRLDGPDSPAAAVWEKYSTGQTQTPTDVITKLAAAGIADGIRGLRLGSPAPEKEPAPWPRDCIGAELWWTPQQTWPVVRGLWRMETSGVQVIVALRLGYTLGVYRVSGWVEHPPTGRKYALGGSLVTPDGRLVDVDTGADVGPASAVDQTIHQIVTSAPILMPPARQPVVRLSAR